MTFCLPVEAAIRINRSLPRTLHAVLDRGKLEAALARPMQTGYGQLLYPTLVARGAALLHGIASAHAFQDGNKRTAWLCTAMYLEHEGSRISGVSDEEAADFVVDVVLGVIAIPDAAIWFLERTAR